MIYESKETVVSRRQFFGIVGLFWFYVTLSNVLYAYGMRTGLASMTDIDLFAPWEARVLQHLILLPILLISYWASLRIQWRPPLVAVSLQIALATIFAALAYPAMVVAIFILHDIADAFHMDHHSHDGMDPASGSLWFASFINFLPTYGFGLALISGFALYIRNRDSELRVLALQRQWSAARLSALRMQLSPHTLFNLLHTIRGTIGWDPKGAQSLVVQLSDLLRRLLRAGERDFAALTEELQFVHSYLALQKSRFADRLSFELPQAIDVPNLWVPSLILQPLIENAVVHGLANHSGAVHIAVHATRESEQLTVRVVNTKVPDGEFPRTGIELQTGIGLQNVRERLMVQFGARARLTTRDAGTEWLAEIELPALDEAPTT